MPTELLCPKKERFLAKKPYAVDYLGALEWNLKKVTYFVENERHTACATCCIALMYCPKVVLLQILDGKILMYSLYRLIANPLLSSCEKPYNQVKKSFPSLEFTEMHVILDSIDCGTVGAHSKPLYFSKTLRNRPSKKVICYNHR